MRAKRVFSRRLIRVLFGILIWFGLGNSVFSFSIGSVLGGAIALAIVLVLIGVLVDGRLPRLVEGRPMRALAFIYGSLVVLVIVYDVIQALRFDEPTLLGSLYVPGVVSLVSSIGLLILAVALTWELVRLWRQ